MEVELVVKEIKLCDLKSGDWFVPFGIGIHFSQESSVWMLVDVPITIFARRCCTTGAKVVVKVAHVQHPSEISKKDGVKSIIPIGVIDEMDSQILVCPLDHEKSVLKLQEKKLVDN